MSLNVFMLAVCLIYCSEFKKGKKQSIIKINTAMFFIYFVMFQNVSSANAREWWETLPAARAEPLLTPLACMMCKSHQIPPDVNECPKG